MAKKLIFENETCGRCGGSGSYSYNQMDGSMCYGCSGRGVRLTKRGDAAQEFFRNSLKKPINEIKVGMIIKENNGWDNGWFEVLAINENPIDSRCIAIDTEKAVYYYEKGAFVKCIINEEDYDSLRMNAIAYQDTLTKSGKPRNR